VGAGQVAKASSPHVAAITFASIGTVASGGLLPALNKSLWIDEGASLYSAHLGWHALWQQSNVVDRVLLIYYVILHFWIGISPSIEWVRFVSVIAFGFTVIVIGHLGKRLGGMWCGVIASVLTACNPLMIDAALDARPYALSALAATVAIYALVRWRDNGSDHWFWWFCIAWIIALVLQLFAVLAPLAVFIVAFAFRPDVFRRAWRRIAAPLVVTLLVTVVFALLVLGQRGQVDWIAPMSVGRLFLDAYGPAGGYPGLGKLRYAKVIVVLAVLGVVLIVFARRRGGRVNRTVSESFVIALSWAALPTIGLIAVSFIKPFYVDRYVTASAPGMALAIGLLLVQALQLNEADRPTWRVRLEVVALGLLVVVLAANAVTISSTAFENYRGVASYLEHHVGSDDEVALPAHELGESVEYYVRGDHEHLNTWPESSTQLYIGAFDLRTDKSSFDSAPRNVWVVEDDIPGTAVFTNDLTRRGYALVGARGFVSLRVVTVAHYRRG
jgi:hypothetical protein